MYHIGDKVVHQIEGACYIEDKISMLMNNMKRSYFKLVPLLDQKAVIYIPVEHNTQDRIRPVITYKEMRKAEQKILCAKTSWVENDKTRLKSTAETLKSFDFLENALLIKTLIIRNNLKALSAREQQYLLSAQKLVYSEIAMVLNQEYETVDKKMEIYYQRQFAI